MSRVFSKDLKQLEDDGVPNIKEIQTEVISAESMARIIEACEDHYGADFCQIIVPNSFSGIKFGIVMKKRINE